MSLPSTSQLRLAVVFGGRSSEHGVSCLTAANVLQVVDRDRFDVTPVGITRDGDWVRETGVVARPASRAPCRRSGRRCRRSTWDDLRGFDVVLPLLHGPWGEDGTIQGLFEMAGVRYVGAGVLASSVAMDKPFTKTVFSAAGLPQIPYVTVLPRQWERDRGASASTASRRSACRCSSSRPGPGSSSGVMMVDALGRAGVGDQQGPDFDPKVLVEAAVQGKRELECGVIQELDGTAVASVVGEIVVQEDSAHEFYDFEAKYLDGTSTNIVPADIPEVALRPHPCVRRPGVRGDRVRGPGPRRLLPAATTASSSSTRSTPCRGSRPTRCSRCCGRRAASPTPSSSTGCCSWRWTADSACAS